MSSSDSDISGRAKIIMMGALIAVYGTYHHFATNNIDINNALVTNKYKRYRMVRRGKRSVLETDYYIETDKGLLEDESDIFELEPEGDEYKTVEVGHVYTFKVNHDKLLKTNNTLDAIPQQKMDY